MQLNANIYANKYSSQSWDIMAKAYELATRQIGGSPHVQRDRLARAIMMFFDRGVDCADTLSALAISREMGLVALARNHRNPTFADQSNRYMIDQIRGEETVNGKS